MPKTDISEFLRSFVTSCLIPAIYILTSVAVMKMVRKIGVGAPWRAWIPGAKEYVLGRVADEDAHRRDRRETKFRVLLPLLTGIVGVLEAVFIATFFVMFFVLIAAIYAQNAAYGEAISSFLMTFLHILAIAAVLLYIPFCFAFWHIYRVFCPNRAVLFLLLNVFLCMSVPVTLMIAAARKPIPKFTFDDILPDSPNYDLWNDNASGTDTL